MTNSPINDFLKCQLENLSGKKNAKMIVQFFENLVKSHGKDLEYNIVTVLFESIDWQEAIESQGLKETWKLDYLKKKLRQLRLEPNFVDYFGPSISECQNKTLIYEKFREILKLLKVGHPHNLIFSTSFAMDILDDRQGILGMTLLKEHLVESASQERTQALSSEFVLTLGEFLKSNDKAFKEVHESVKSFFQSHVAGLKNIHTKTLFCVGEPEMLLTEVNKEFHQFDFARLLKSTPPLYSIIKELAFNRGDVSEVMKVALKEANSGSESEIGECLLHMCEDNAEETSGKSNSSEASESAYAKYEFAMESLQFDPEGSVGSQSFAKSRVDETRRQTSEWRMEEVVRMMVDYYGKKVSWEGVLKSVMKYDSFSSAKTIRNENFYFKLVATVELITRLTNARLSNEFIVLRWSSREFQFLFLMCLMKSWESRTALLKDMLSTSNVLQGEHLSPAFTSSMSQLESYYLDFDFLIHVFDLATEVNSKATLMLFFENAFATNFDGVFYVLVLLSQKSANELIKELLGNAVMMILDSPNNFSDLMEALFKLNRSLLIRILKDICYMSGKEGPNSSTQVNSTVYMQKLLDLGQTIKDFLIPLTQSDFHYFSISLSLLAIKREYLRLENWMDDRMSNGGVNWINDMLLYVQRNFLGQVKSSSTKKEIEECMERSHVSGNLLLTIFDNYLLSEKYASVMSKQAVEKVTEFYRLIKEVLPDVIQVSTSDTEKKSNEILENYYSGRTSIDEFIANIKSLKNATGNSEQEVLSCIIINIIDEFRFYQSFPEKELYLTSDIYGQFIANKLIDGKALAIFLKAISDSLEKEGKMFSFGLKALTPFYLDTSLAIPNDFYKMLFANEKLKKNHFKMLFELSKKLAQVNKEKLIDAENMKTVTRNMEAQNKASEEIIIMSEPPKTPIEKLKVIERTLAEMLTRTFESLEKSDEIAEKSKENITYWLNGLDDKKAERSLSEFEEYMKESSLMSWFAKYLVYKRVPSEPLMQNSYRKLIYRSNVRNLYKQVYKNSMRMINLVIDFVSAKESLLPEEKTMARFCGKWIGLITFVCNKPMQLSDLDIKRRLYECVENKSVSNIIPIVCALIKSIDKSALFNPKVPLINSLFDILREILHTPWINHTTKIFIEVLFTEFEIPEKTIYKFDYIIKRRESEALTTTLPNTQIDAALYQEFNLTNSLHVDIRQLVSNAIGMAIQDLIRPVLERSVKIALETTRDLVVKDFSWESDEQRMLEGACNMIQNLSWNLALVTCRDPLRNQLADHISQLLRIQSDLNEAARKTLRETLTNTHLDVACQIVKKHVMENSISELMKDETIVRELEIRKASKEQLSHGNVAPFHSTYVSKYVSELPVEINSISNMSEFGKIEIYFGKWDEGWMTERTVSKQEKPKIEDLLDAIDKQMDSQNDKEKLKAMQNLYINLRKTIESTKDIEAMIPKLVDVVLAKVMQNNITLEALRYYGDILVLYRNHFVNLPVYVSNWIMNQKAPSCYKSDVIKFFLKTCLMDVTEFDRRMASQLCEVNVEGEVCVILLLKIMVIEERVFSIYSFPEVIGKIIKLSESSAMPPLNLENSIFVNNLVQFVSNENAVNSLKLNMSNLEPEYNKLFIDMKSYFTELNETIFELVCEIVTRLAANAPLNALMTVYESHKQLILDEVAFVTYFSYLFEVVVNMVTVDSLATNQFLDNAHLDYRCIDNLTMYIVLIIEQLSDAVSSFEKILTSFIMVLTKKHFCEDNARLNQRPFFRILNNLILEIHGSSFAHKSIINDFDVIIIQTIHILQPLKYPGFVFAWLQFMSSPTLLNSILKNAKKELSSQFTILVIDLMSFLRDVFVLNEQMAKEMEVFYRGVLRVMLLLIINFPDYVCENSFAILEETSPRFIQFRNMILSAYPKDLRSPDPFDMSSQNYQSSLEHKTMQPLNGKVECRVHAHNIQTRIANFMKTKNLSEVDSIVSTFYVNRFNGERMINTALVESFVIYVPHLIYTQYQSALSESMLVSYKDLSYSIFIRMFEIEDEELHERIINAMLNNIRYPSSITFFFKNLIIMIFSEYNENNIQEQITKNLFERLIIEKPHTWGILSLFYKILANVNFKFDEKKFYMENDKFIDRMIQLAFRYAKINDEKMKKIN